MNGFYVYRWGNNEDINQFWSRFIYQNFNRRESQL